MGQAIVFYGLPTPRQHITMFYKHLERHGEPQNRMRRGSHLL
jgi:hypothetical protein